MIFVEVELTATDSITDALQTATGSYWTRQDPELKSQTTTYTMSDGLLNWIHASETGESPEPIKVRLDLVKRTAEIRKEKWEQVRDAFWTGQPFADNNTIVTTINDGEIVLSLHGEIIAKRTPMHTLFICNGGYPSMRTAGRLDAILGKVGWKARIHNGEIIASRKNGGSPSVVTKEAIQIPFNSELI